jgi:hypothetical protein
MPFQKGNKLASTAVKSRTVTWENVGEYVIAGGSAEFVRIVMSWARNKDTERQFVDTYLSALEYFKPKLARVELKNPEGEAFHIKVDI